jgi:hypothetical protein
MRKLKAGEVTDPATAPATMTVADGKPPKGAKK